MRELKYVLFVLLLHGVVMADTPQPITVDFANTYAPALEVYQANIKTFKVTLTMAGAAMNIAGNTGVLYWARDASSSGIVPATCTLVSSGTSGIFNARFSPSDLNTNGADGPYIYGVGIVSGNVTIARQGSFTIKPDPYATGASPITFTTNVNASLITWTGTMTVPFFVGDGSGLTGIGAAQTGGLASVVYVTNAIAGHTNLTVANGVHGMGSIAASNNTDYYHTSNPSNYTTAGVTDLLSAAYLIHKTNLTDHSMGSAAQSNSTAFVSASQTNEFLHSPATGGVWGTAQYPLALLTNGENKMGANLNMGINSITNVGNQILAGGAIFSIRTPSNGIFNLFTSLDGGAPRIQLVGNNYAGANNGQVGIYSYDQNNFVQVTTSGIYIGGPFFIGTTNFNTFISTATNNLVQTNDSRAINLSGNVSFGGTNILALIGATSNSIATATNAAIIDATNRADIAATGKYVKIGGGDTLQGALYTVRSNGWAGNELVSADGARSFAASGVIRYMSSNTVAVGYAPFSAQLAITTPDTNLYKSAVAITNTGAYYCHSMVDTNPVTATLIGPDTVVVYCGTYGTGPIGNQAMSISLEKYYSYDTNSATLYGDWASPAQAIQNLNGPTNIMTFNITHANTDVTNAYMVYRIKKTSSANTTNFFVCGGNGFASHAQTPQPSVETLGPRGATNMTANGVQAGSYNATTRTFDYNGTIGGSNVIALIGVLSSITNATTWDIELPTVRKYVAKLPGTNTIVSLSGTIGAGYAWLDVGWASTPTGTFTARTNSVLWSTTNTAAAMTLGVPVDSWVGFNVTNLASGSSNMFLSIGTVAK